MYNKTIIDYALEAKDNAVELFVEHMQSLCILSVFVLLGSWGRKFWLNAVHFIMLMQVVWLIFGDIKENFLGIKLWENPEKLDDTHMLLGRLIAVLCLVNILHHFLLSKSTDNTVQSSLIWTMTLFASATLLALGYASTHPSKKASALKLHGEWMQTGFFSSLLLTLITLYYFLRNSEWGGYGESRSHANMHLRVEFVFLTVGGLVMYTLPQVPIKYLLGVQTIDPIHAYLMRCGGSLVLGMAFLVCRSANFLWQQAKDSVILTNLMFYMTMAAVTWYSLLGNWANVSWQQVGFQGLLYIVLMLNAFGAMDRDVTCFNRLLIARFKEVPDDIRGLLKRKYL